MSFELFTLLKNFLPKDIVRTYLDICTDFNNRVVPAKTFNYGEQGLNLSHRVTDNIVMPTSLLEYTTNSVKELYENILIQKYRQPIKSIEPAQLLQYKVGGKYDIHNDSEDIVNGQVKRICERDLTIIAYLNDNYAGGELEFPDWGVTFKPKAGDIIAFPSYIEYSHRVHPVTSGTRYCLVTWVCTNQRIYHIER